MTPITQKDINEQVERGTRRLEFSEKRISRSIISINLEIEETQKAKMKLQRELTINLIAQDVVKNN